MLSYKSCGDITLSLAPAIQNQSWYITGTERAEYIEAWDFSAHSATGPDDGGADDDDDGCDGGGGRQVPSCQYGPLVDGEILDWVAQRGNYVPPRHQDTSRALQVAIRLLVLERTYYQPPSFHIKQETYLAIEKQFYLPANSLLALANDSGMSTHVLDVDEKTGKLKRLGMIVKAHQKFQVGNYGLAFSYDFGANIATGILHGTGVTQYGDDYGLWSRPAAAEIFEHIKAARHFWTHPLCLPTTLLQHHLLRTDHFCTVTLNNQHTYIQHQLGVVRAGRLSGQQPRNIAMELPVQQAKVNLAELTVAMSGLTFDAIWFCSVSDWQCSCMKLLLEVLTEIEGMGIRPRGARLMRTRIRYLTSLAESIRRHTIGMKENGQADMSVLHSIISQVDNRLNARLAAASSHDSAAMKTLAFLTALFLPGTFVATIFSTSFFNWQNNGMIVSKLFWVYWALAAPLTIVVAVGWRLWWSFEKKRFDQDIKAEIKAINGNGNGNGNGEVTGGVSRRPRRPKYDG
ncbi:hypothetical protein F5Y12DRAFT_779702 [Xylaria sp. FL1777]|nr:hypothetical protein F5Y12DRAFT_779702 [Xylaria sp. FL1777]